MKINLEKYFCSISEHKGHTEAKIEFEFEQFDDFIINENNVMPSEK